MPYSFVYIESFNGKFRDECLNEQWFETLPQARLVIGDWRKDYNEVRPPEFVNDFETPGDFSLVRAAVAFC